MRIHRVRLREKFYLREGFRRCRRGRYRTKMLAPRFNVTAQVRDDSIRALLYF